MQKVTTKVCCSINLKTSLDAASFADQNALFIEVQFKWECLKILKIQIEFNDRKPQNDHNKDWSIWPSSPCLQSSDCSILMFVKWECKVNMFEILKIFVQISSIWSFENLIWPFTLMMKWCLNSNRCIWMQIIIFCKEIWCKKWQQKFVVASIWKHH